MKNVEILLSVMHQNDCSIVTSMNLETDILIINQCDKNKYEENIYNGHKVRMIYTTERGLSRSRNMALKNAKGDICIICDEGETFCSGYRDAILSAYKEKPNAALIAFNVNRTDSRGALNKKITKFEKYNTKESFCSKNLTFQREIILKNNVFFNTNFGAGSGKISCGEESLWQRSIKNIKLEMYKHPFTIAQSGKNKSTWFTGYDEKFFYDKGFYLAETMPKSKHFVKYYFVLRLLSVCKLSIKKQVRSLNMGIKGHKDNLSYLEYINKHN